MLFPERQCAIYSRLPITMLPPLNSGFPSFPKLCLSLQIFPAIDIGLDRNPNLGLSIMLQPDLSPWGIKKSTWRIKILYP